VTQQKTFCFEEAWVNPVDFAKVLLALLNDCGWKTTLEALSTSENKIFGHDSAI
jgi:hypothetical protein